MSVAILAADSKLPFWAAWTVMNNCRSQFVWQCAQLKESAVGRVVERQVTPDLPDHVVLLPPLLVPPLLVRRCWFRRCWFSRCFVFRCWYRWCNVNRIAFAIFWISLGSFAFARCGDYKKSGFYSCRPPHLGFFAAPEAYKRVCLSIIQSTVFPHYNGVYKKSRIKTPTATRNGRYVHVPPASSFNCARERLGSTTSKNVTAQQAQGGPQAYAHMR